MNEMEPMDEFERALKKALRPVNPPESLARFLALATEAEQPRRRSGKGWLWWKPASGGQGKMLPRQFPVWLSGAVAALLVFAVFAGQQVHVRHERARADQQFALSLQIEARAMEHTRLQLQRAGVPLD